MRLLIVIALICISFVDTHATPIYKCNNTNGFWIKGEENIWYEILSNGKTNTYVQAKVDAKYIYLYDEIREIGIALPKKNGECYLTAQGKEGEWSKGSEIRIEESYIQFVDEEQNDRPKKSGAITADVDMEEENLDVQLKINDEVVPVENLAGN